MKLLLIDNSVKDYQIFDDSKNNNTLSIIYDKNNDTYQNVLDKINILNQFHILNSIESIAVVSHGVYEPKYRFLDSENPATLMNIENIDPELDSWSDFINFLNNIKGLLVNIKHLDLLGCALLSFKEWKYILEKIENQIGINIRASNDATGNLKYGGNWELESDDINIKNIYFTEMIEGYDRLLLTKIGGFKEFGKLPIRFNDNGELINVWGNTQNGGTSPGPINDIRAIYSTKSAFAALKSNGSVVTWGHVDYGGDSSSLSLTSVTAIYSAGYAFAALKSDGSVVTWGHYDGGGDSSSVSAELTSGVTAIYSNWFAFAALKSNGSVVTWGNSNGGGDSSSVSTELESGVIAIYGTKYAFAALKSDGSVVTWGNSDYGSNSSSVSADLTSGVTAIYSTIGVFAALKSDGSVVTWGTNGKGGDSSGVTLTNVITINSTEEAFAALKSDGSVVTWGNTFYGGNSSSVSIELESGVTAIYSNKYAFAALKSDGSVVTWGNTAYGGDSFGLNLTNVTAIYTNLLSFAALKSDGSVVTWGYNTGGGDSSSVTLTNVTAIYSNLYSYAALKSDGSVVTWGFSTTGGDSSSVTLTNVTAIYSASQAFAAFSGTVSSYDNDNIITDNTLSNIYNNPNSNLRKKIDIFYAVKPNIISYNKVGNVITLTLDQSLTDLQKNILKQAIIDDYQEFNIILTNEDITINDGSTEIVITSPSTSAGICFLKGTPVITDQGKIPIDEITNKNTINNQEVVKVTKFRNMDKYMILFQKDSLSFNVPSKDTFISREHGIYINNKLVRAKKLVNGDNIKEQEMGNHNIYNVLLHKHSKMIVNNMIVETLNPNHKLAKKYIK